MKKATIKARFRDKDNHSVVYNPGEVAEFSDDRVVALTARGLVEPVADEAENTEDTEKEAPAKSAKGKKGKTSKTKKEDAVADNPGESDAPEEVETENETINPDKDEQ